MLGLSTSNLIMSAKDRPCADDPHSLTLGLRASLHMTTWIRGFIRWRLKLQRKILGDRFVERKLSFCGKIFGQRFVDWIKDIESSGEARL